ncbi:hypothetical protein TRAPUB_13712 [Trametes pubescens]|uniref:Uncharacterized protein n=1 Tax=Trametes pubescens TaxID=154538 RepID=A0A1M2VQS0_TRAPU|nr:hypothetical protein TRAPUB_13712 [Trametes pubescens]
MPSVHGHHESFCDKEHTSTPVSSPGAYGLLRVKRPPSRSFATVSALLVAFVMLASRRQREQPASKPDN